MAATEPSLGASARTAIANLSRWDGIRATIQTNRAGVLRTGGDEITFTLELEYAAKHAVIIESMYAAGEPAIHRASGQSMQNDRSARL